jgi:hypothetical protein
LPVEIASIEEIELGSRAIADNNDRVVRNKTAKIDVLEGGFAGYNSEVERNTCSYDR